MSYTYAIDLLGDWDQRLPVDPAEYARRCGLTVRPEPELQDLKMKVFTDVPAGEILCNPYTEEREMRFAVATELGRYMSRVMLDDALKRRAEGFFYDLSPEHFAAELLMPESAVRMNLSKDCCELCRLFGVRAKALEIRLRMLRLI